MRTRSLILAALVALLTVLTVRVSGQPTGNEGFVQRALFASDVTSIPVGQTPTEAEPSPDGTRVYVSNRDSGTLSVIDTATNTVIQSVPVGDDPGRLAVSRDGSLIAVTNVSPATITILDAHTLEITHVVSPGGEPRAITFSPDGDLLYFTDVTSELSNPGFVKIIDTATGQIIGPAIQVGTMPEFIEFTPDGTKIYVANMGNKRVSAIDPHTNTVVATIPVGGVPGELGFTNNSESLFVIIRRVGDPRDRFGAKERFVVIDTATDTVVAGSTYPIGFNGVVTPHGTFFYSAGAIFSDTVTVYKLEGPASEDILANMDLAPDLFEVEVDEDQEREEPEEAYLRAFIELLAGMNVADIDVTTTSLTINGTVLAPAENPSIEDNVLSVHFRLTLANTSAILGLTVTEVEVDESDGKVEVKATTAPTQGVDLIQLAAFGDMISGGSFRGTDTVRMMQEE